MSITTVIVAFDPEDGDLYSIVEIPGDLDLATITHHQDNTYAGRYDPDPSNEDVEGHSLDQALDFLVEVYVNDHKTGVFER
jgi:hypothetical protein